MIEIQEIGSEKFSRYNHPLIRLLHDCFAPNKPIDDSTLENLLPNLLVCARPERFRTSPPIIFCGQKSASAEVFGLKWAKIAPLIRGTGKPVVEDLFANGYRVAADKGWFCDESEGFLDTGNGEEFVSFVRYIQCIETDGGAKLFAVAGEVRHRALQ